MRQVFRSLYPIYRRTRIFLYCFALGLAFLWMVKGPPSLSEVAVDLPAASSEVLSVVPYKISDMPPGGGGSGGRRMKIMPAPATAAADRDLSLYDIATEVEDCSWMDRPEKGQCLAERDRARQFIYEHWRLKKRAYVAVDFPCTDCAPIMHYFIEPDENGTWHIAQILEDVRFPLHKEDDAFDIRFRPPNERERFRESTRTVLSFLNRSGKEVGSF